jgi:hypothetical protein
MNPDIAEIIKVCLRISKYIMFYVPRTLMLEELFDIISKINGKNRLFFDIHILKSANKIKALLIIFGYDIDKKIGEKEIDEYLKYIYGFKLNNIYIKIFSAIAKIIGNYQFFENEINFRKNVVDESLENINIGKELFNYFFNSVFTAQEKIKLKSLKIYSEFKSMNNNKSKKNKKNEKSDINNINMPKKEIDINKDINNEANQSDFINKNTIIYTGDNNDNYLKLKENNKIIEDEKFNDNDLKFSPKKANSNINFGENSELDEKNNLSNSPTPTISTSPSSSKITSNNKNCNLSLLNKDKLLLEECALTSCHEINLNYIPK